MKSPAASTLYFVRFLAMVPVALAAGCAGTAMVADSGSGASVPARGWDPGPWHEDATWRAFGPIGKDDFRPGPWWYDDAAWSFLTVGQGDRGGHHKTTGAKAGMDASTKSQPAAAQPESGTVPGK